MIAKLKPKIHFVLLRLIRGENIKEIASEMGVRNEVIGTWLARARRLVGVRTTYELVALEVINLMEDESQPLIEKVEREMKHMVVGGGR